ncbi:uncharacterized protein LOC114258159 [Camellia sinensis]|uniref:uncharacterized protein LOC114258159 n=1 Tax=Camellia sinensis TaxID=4442 RepID=UPI001036E9B9|nr:uncharacterized protein LOC114258159 [Camellia sinensis]
MTSSIIGELISNEVRNKALTLVSEVVYDFKDYYGIEVSYQRAWMGVEKARGVVFGDYSSSFDDLRWYVDAANNANPGSVFDMEFDVGSKGRYFKCLFFAFEACIYSFKYCQPMLMLDLTFLKGRHKSCLLATTAKNGAGQRFAQEVVEFRDALSKYSIHSGFDFDFVKNDKDRATVHFKHVKRTSSIIGELISNEVRNKALTSVSEVVYDFKDYYGIEVSYQRAWMGVEKARGVAFGDYSSSFDDLRWYVDAANNANPRSVFDMEFDVGSKGRHFKCLFFAFEACIHSFNDNFIIFVTGECGLLSMVNLLVIHLSLVRDECHLFSISLIDAIRVKLMEQFSKRREVGNKWNRTVCPFVEKKLEEDFNDTKAWIVKKCNDDIYEIQLDHSVMVDIGKRSYYC